MIRTADAAGFDGVLLTDQSADLYNMKTLRSMQGSHFHLPVIRLPKEQLLTAIEESQLPIYATTLSQNSIDYKQESLNVAVAAGILIFSMIEE